MSGLFVRAVLIFLLFVNCQLSHSAVDVSIAVKQHLSDSQSINDIAHARSFLQTEMSACVAAQQSIASFLVSKRIPIGGISGSLKKSDIERHPDDEVKSRITISLPDNRIECRIALGRAPLGSKCVAPCGCTGSQKWVQFAELNKLRRKDPSQWQVCPTCQQQFDYSQFALYGGLPANAVGYLLDHKFVLRTALGIAFALVSYIFNFGAIASRVLVSRSLWQMVR